MAVGRVSPSTDGWDSHMFPKNKSANPSRGLFPAMSFDSWCCNRRQGSSAPVYRWKGSDGIRVAVSLKVGHSEGLEGRLYHCIAVRFTGVKASDQPLERRVKNE